MVSGEGRLISLGRTLPVYVAMEASSLPQLRRDVAEVVKPTKNQELAENTGANILKDLSQDFLHIVLL